MANANNQSEKKLLSICIPTFNRVATLKKLVTSILECADPRLEVLVLDNDSQDETIATLAQIKDARFRYIKNEKNVGGLLNGLKALTLGDAEYLLFCLDKDRVEPQRLQDFINFLTEHNNIVAGFLELDITQIAPSKIYTNYADALTELAYSGKHPTGYFFKRSIFLSLDPLNNFTDFNVVGGFVLEFIFAEMCLQGAVAVVTIPLCYTETQAEAQKVKSFTYSKGSNNFFFSPKNRIRVFKGYLAQIYQMDIPQLLKKQLMERLYFKTLLQVTLNLKALYSNAEICSHYSIEPRKISWLELFKNYIYYNSCFIFKTSASSLAERLSIVFLIHFKKIGSKLNQVLLGKKND